MIEVLIIQKVSTSKLEKRKVYSARSSHIASLTGSKVCFLSQMTLMRTLAGPSMPSLSRGLMRVRFLEYGENVTGLSCSCRLSSMSPCELGSPSTPRIPTVSPTGRSSLTKRFAAVAPFSRKHRVSRITGKI